MTAGSAGRGFGGDARAEAITTIEQLTQADFGTRATFASAAASASNPNDPPFLLDPSTKNGEPQPRGLAKFAANAPLAMVDHLCILSVAAFRAATRSPQNRAWRAPLAEASGQSFQDSTGRGSALANGDPAVSALRSRDYAPSVRFLGATDAVVLPRL